MGLKGEYSYKMRDMLPKFERMSGDKSILQPDFIKTTRNCVVMQYEQFAKEVQMMSRNGDRRESV